MGILSRIAAGVVFIAFASQVSAYSEDFCELYPITLPGSLLEGQTEGQSFSQIPLGNGQGNFSWLTWSGRNDANTLANSLIPPGDSNTFVHPYDSADILIEENDWVQGSPGVKNGSKVRNNLDALIGRDIIIPIWSQNQSQGSNFNYHVYKFAVIEITDYKLNGKGWLSFNYKGFTHCYNEPPVAEDSHYETPEDVAVITTAVATDVDGDVLSYSVLQQPQNGTLSGAGPDFTYTPNTNFNGSDSFTFIANDGEEDSNVGTVTITVTPVNDAPTAFNQELTLNEDESLELTLTGTDIDGDAISFAVVSQPQNGVLSGTAPNLTYTPNKDFNGQDQFTFKTNDGQLDSAEAVILLNVLPVNDAPVANDLSVVTIEDEAVGITLDGFDIDGDTISYSVLTQPSNGVVTGTDKELVYTPNAGFFGNDSFTYKVNDGQLDSNIATVAIEVKEKNKPPVITSIPTVDATQFSQYSYDVEATDPNINDVLSYSLLNFPSGSAIESSSGVITWKPTDQFVASNSLDNPYCAASQLVSNDQDLVSDVIVTIDESGSMSGEHAWIRDLVPLLDAHLKSNDIGDGNETNHYGLVGYGNSAVKPRQIDINGLPFGTSEAFIEASKKLVTSGGTEDGWAGIEFASKYPFRDSSSKNYILVTDEDRDNTDNAITAEVITQILSDQNAILNVVVNATFQCGDGTPALGLGQNGIGYVADGRGGFTLCSGATVKSAAGTTKRDYIDLALALEGAAWDLNFLRSGGVNAQSFSAAFVAIKVQEIKQQFEAIPEADVAVTKLTYDSETISIDVKNRGLKDVSSSINIRLYDSGSLLETFTADSLLSFETKSFTKSLDSLQVTGQLSAVAEISDPQVKECFVENNELFAAPFEVQVSDLGGLTDSQLFALSASDSNEPPTIVSTPVTSASVDTRYSYHVKADDPDIGDGHSFSISKGPAGLTVDSISGIIDFKPNSSQVGEHEVEVVVSDLSSATDTQAFSITIDGSYIAPKFISEPTIRAIQGTTYTYQPQVQSDATATISFRLFRGPEGLQIDNETGQLTWAVPENIKGKSFPVILQVEDHKGNYDLQSYNIIGDIPPVAPKFSHQQLPYVEQNKYINRTLTASDQNSVDTLTWELVQGPSNATLDSANGAYRWQADAKYPAGQPNFNQYCHIEDSPLNNLEMQTKWMETKAFIIQPLVGPLFDSNQDGFLNEQDKSFIVGNNTSRHVVAIEAVSNQEVWRRTDLAAHRRHIGTLVNLDNDLDTEYVFVQEGTNKLVALNSDGSTKWVSNEPVTNSNAHNYNAVSHADLDGDGTPEILFGPSVFNNEGQLLWQFPLPSETYTNAAYGNSLAVDLTGDGKKEVAYYNEVRDSEGNLLWTTPSGTSRTVYYSYFAHGDFDGDGEPELVVNERSNRGYWIRLIDNDGSMIWEVRHSRTGNLIVADFTGDGHKEIFSTSSNLMLDKDGEIVWNHSDWGHYIGSTVADVDGDGYLDILSINSGQLYIRKGATGQLSRKYNNGHSSWAPQSTVAFVDIDKDGQGEIISAGGSYMYAYEGVNGWPSAPTIFNQHLFTKGMSKSDLSLNPNFDESVYGQVSDAASEKLEDGRLSELVINSVRAYPINTGWRIHVAVSNAGSAASADNTTIEIFADDKDSGHKLGEISVASLSANSSAANYYLDVAKYTDLGSEIIAVLKSDSAAECSSDNNIASSVNLEATVTDMDGLSDTEFWSVGVKEAPVAPVFDSTPTTTATVGQLYEYTLSATDINKGDVIRYAAVTIPAGMSLDNYSGDVRWIPGHNQAGRHYVRFQAYDLAGKVAYHNYYLTVQASGTNQAPVIESEAVKLASANYEYRYTVKATDPEGGLLKYALTEAPAGMTINGLSGAITWLPTDTELGSHTVTIQVTDDGDLSTTQSFQLEVRTNAPPQISSQPNGSVSIESTYIYQVEASDPDGDALEYSLTSYPEGMTIDEDGLLSWTTTADDLGEHGVIVRATDIFGAYVEQSFVLTVTDSIAVNNPPAITSTPSGSVTFGNLYEYQVSATDADGDELTYLLTLSPSGMAIDNQSGLISWTPGLAQVGIHDVIIRVEDGKGGYATQSYSIFVSDGTSTNELPVITSEPGFNAKATFEYTYQVLATDPDGDDLTYHLTDFPAGMTITNDGLISWTPSSEESVPVKVRVSDGKGYIEQGWTLKVLDADSSLTGELSISPKYADEGETVTIQVSPINAVAPVAIELLVDGQPVALDSSNKAQITAGSIGEHSIKATITDKYETAVIEDSYHVKDPNDTNEPVLTIHQPMDAEVVTAPTDIVATIDDQNLVSWRLVAKEKGAPADEFVLLAEGTNTAQNESLGTFDPSLVQNGQYAIVLEATDSNGQTTQENVVVSVEGDLKVGNFSITFEDVNIPVAGIPITVTRTYDTRQKHKDLDFGHGWSVGYQNVRLQESRTVGLGWSLNEYKSGLFSNWCVEPNGDPVVSVTLPDGRVEKFVAKASPHCQQIVPTVDVNIVFEPMSGTTSTLSQSGFGLVRLYNGNIVDLAEPDRPIDPDFYKLTTADGFVYDINQNFGVSKITEPTGHSLSFTKQGVVHSGGKGISFVRDSNDNIKAIDLPDGTQIKYEFDSNGDLVAHRDQLDNATQFTYNSAHGLLDIIDPRGVRVTRNEYDDSGKLIAQIDPDGNRIEFTHDIDSRLEVIKNRRGFTQVFTYDDMGNILTESNGEGEVTTRTYDGDQNVLSKTDALGNTTSWTYDNNRNQLTETDALGNVTEYTYNSLNKPLTEKGPDGNILVTNTYKSNGQLTSSTNALGEKTDFTYSTSGLSSFSDSLGTTASYTYSGDNIASETDANGVTTSYTYDSMGRKLTESVTRTNSQGVAETLTTSYEYDAKGRVIKTTAPDGSVTRTEYNVFDKETAVIDALGQRTEFEYDSRGNLVKTTYPDGSTETQAYDEENNLVSQTDRAGRTTTMVYDGANRLIKTIYPDSSETRTEYDAAGRVVANIDQRGNRTEYTLDAAGRQIAVKDALGNVTRYEYDKRGNRVKITDANDNTYTYVYDLANRLIETVFPDGSKTTTSYDVRGRKVSETDQAGNTTQFVYDGNGNLIKVIDALGQETTYGYDELNNKISQTDAELRTTQWSYNQNGQVISRTLPMGQVETFEYDDNGNRTKHTDFNGQVTTFTYDNLGREIRRDYLASGDFVETAYTTSGQVASVTDKHGVTAYSYDGQDRLIKVSYPNGETIDYSYDAAGNRTQVKTQHSIVDYGFDELNRLQTVTEGLNVTSYTYDKVGNRASVNYANGTSIEYQYNNLNRLTRVTHKDGSANVTQQFDYTLGLAGNRLQIAELTGRVVDYTYDKLYRLTSEVVTDAINGNRTTSFTYDKVGNRLTQIESGITTTYSYNDNDQILEEYDGSVLTSYEYDANGNTTKKTEGSDVTFYDYSQDNRLLRATTPAEVIDYSYDASGIRQSKSVNGAAIHYLVDQNQDYAQVISELDELGNAQINYVYGDDLISQTQSSQEHYFMYDGLGSTRSLTNSAGVETDSYIYEAFGEIEHKNGTTPNNYLFTGEQYDPNLGFYYLRARYYNQSNGRFFSLDTYQGSRFEPQTLHKYLYTHADPINNTDPSGYMTMGSVMSGVNIVGNLYTVASISFQIYTGNYAGASKELIEEVVYSKFGGAFGKRVVKYTKEQLGLFYRSASRQLDKPLKLGLPPNSKTLTHNLEAVGVLKPTGTQAHHIVGGVTRVGKRTQARLQKLGVDLNSAMNGVFLPGCGKSKAIGMVHCGKHTEAYERAVAEVLDRATDKTSAINALTEIRNGLLNGTFTPLNKRSL